MIEIQPDTEHTGEIIAHAIKVFEETGSIVEAIEAVKPIYAEKVEVEILKALAAALGGESQ